MRQNAAWRLPHQVIASDYTDFASTCLICMSISRVSSAPAESGMAHLVNQRMGKKQSMRSSAEGAHQLLQGRSAVLDGQLENFFPEWFPGFRDNLGSFERAM
jgi:hypothetical protein